MIGEWNNCRFFFFWQCCVPIKKLPFYTFNPSFSGFHPKGRGTKIFPPNFPTVLLSDIPQVPHLPPPNTPFPISPTTYPPQQSLLKPPSKPANRLLFLTVVLLLSGTPLYPSPRTPFLFRAGNTAPRTESYRPGTGKKRVWIECGDRMG